MSTNIKRRQIAANGDEAINKDGWMVTFSDVIMLIITFFVMILTMSSINRESLKETLNCLKESIGGTTYPGYVKNGEYVNIIAALKNIDKPVGIKEDERGIVVTISENILFDTGKFTMRKENYRILDSIAAVIESCSNEIMIMGHTDDLPLKSGKYESNWELAGYRGISVLDYFIKNKKLPESRFHVGGYGASRPLFPNNSSKHRALNRRVEIIFKHKEV
ncbi:MAG: OmpA family protein [Proteobacteria bacterium]|nr:OmpA family protein [Pseudomonadota bacterium]